MLPWTNCILWGVSYLQTQHFEHWLLACAPQTNLSNHFPVFLGWTCWTGIGKHPQHIGCIHVYPLKQWSQMSSMFAKISHLYVSLPILKELTADSSHDCPTASGCFMPFQCWTCRGFWKMNCPPMPIRSARIVTGYIHNMWRTYQIKPLELLLQSSLKWHDSVHPRATVESLWLPLGLVDSPDIWWHLARDLNVGWYTLSGLGYYIHDYKCILYYSMRFS